VRSGNAGLRLAKIVAGGVEGLGRHDDIEGRGCGVEDVEKEM
jgi:hypothetical protein